MTTFTVRTKRAIRSRRIPRLMLLAAVLSPVPVWSEPTSPAPLAEPARVPEKPADLSDSLDRARFSNMSSSHYYNNVDRHEEPAFFFFPPAPPPLDSELRILPPFSSGVAAPPELGPYVGETFYPMLASRLVANDLTKAQRAELDAYRDKKLLLLNALRSRIAALKDLSPAVREQQLAEFARQQASPLAELESFAEKIRTGMLRPGLLGKPTESGLWSDSAVWRTPVPGEPAPVDRPHREAQALRAAAYFQDGLAPAQRRLLCEMAGAFDTPIEPVQLPAPAGKSPLLEFSPETAKFRLLADLPAPLAGKIGDYVAKKRSLKTDLLDALQREATAGEGARSEALKLLATAQAPVFSELETAAEDIRRDLSALPDPPGPPPSPALPADLVARISAYRAHKVDLLKKLYALLASPAAPAAAPPSSPKGESPWIHDGETQTAVRLTNLRVSVEEFNRQQRVLVGELNQELAGIRAALSAYVRANDQPTDRKSINDLLTDFERARQEQELWEKYRDYQAAVLLPGLAPEQRRLLFAAGLEELALPLPSGERIN